MLIPNYTNSPDIRILSLTWERLTEDPKLKTAPMGEHRSGKVNTNRSDSVPFHYKGAEGISQAKTLMKKGFRK